MALLESPEVRDGRKEGVRGVREEGGNHKGGTHRLRVIMGVRTWFALGEQEKRNQREDGGEC